MATFAGHKIPFPLFEAPVSEAREYAGKSTCLVCNGPDRHCFTLNIGCALIIPCPECGVENSLDANDQEAANCRSCESKIAFPKVPKKQDIRICYPCLRAGKGAITKDTEFGMVSWEQAFEGITHGVPGLQTAEFEMVLTDPEDDWYGVRILSDYLFELLRTPTYHTWQGERWLFCCKRPMTYIGEWKNVMMSSHRPNDPKKFLESVRDRDDSGGSLWEGISEGKGGLSVYVFQCKACGQYRANSDMD